MSKIKEFFKKKCLNDGISVVRKRMLKYIFKEFLPPVGEEEVLSDFYFDRYDFNAVAECGNKTIQVGFTINYGKFTTSAYISNGSGIDASRIEVDDMKKKKFDFLCKEMLRMLLNSRCRELEILDK